MFELVAQDRESKARRGRIATAHGVLDTPAFMPIGTQGAVKGVSPQELRELHAQIILGNTYHLFVRPALDVIKHFGGLHKLMDWNGPILTASGGYQIFSLAKLRKITEDGVEFQNHIDGARAFISPEIAREIQLAVGTDITMTPASCVLPTRLARNGTAFAATGTLNLKNAEFALDKRPIEENCACEACREFSRGYIRHLVKAEEILGLRLITLHNLHFYLNLMNRVRSEIKAGTFDQFRKTFVAEYKTRDAMRVE